MLAADHSPGREFAAGGRHCLGDRGVDRDCCVV
jgi:hypothetical protein